ncbi:uncharacterized protein LOC134193319 isoform X3 [Corticium candelabrum]|uniref:uncharacterized protein LOC134193319 isoform X3 n=1 Tax=Corticium candelabrum TaxID=121492 RepID=UPI002E25465E|nr:uncharacterized protein LOC134193319 isoform X3 [Corticium candelabrum]
MAVSSGSVSSFSDDHSQSINRLMLIKSLSEFKKAIKKEKVDIKRVNDDNTSLLHWYCSSGRQDIVEYLLQVGVPITANKTNHQTPLHCAVDCNDKMKDTKRANIVRSLVAAEVEVDQQDVNGWTALKLACRSGLYECAYYLLSNGADAEKCDFEGNTALHDAVCHSTTTRLLISYVDDVDVVNYEHKTSLLLAVCSESKEREQTVSYLVHSGADVNKEDASGQFPLWLAANRKDTSIIQILLDGRPDVNKAEPQEKTTALHRAVINKAWPVCVLLVRHGADVDLPDAEGMTALDYAKKFHPEMAEQMKAESAEQKSKASTLVLEALFEQLAGGHFDHLEQLLGNLPDVNLQAKGCNLIHMAVVHYRFDATVLLQQKGANLSVQTFDGNTPLHLTCQWPDEQQETLRILRFLVTSQVQLDIKNSSGETALFLAAGAGLSDHVYCLLDAGADPHQCNKRGLLPLHIACSRPETVKVTWSLINYCIRYLLEFARDTVNIPDYDGWTSLMYAAKTGCADTVQSLLAFEAEVNIQEPNKGYTALYLAVIAKSLEICQLLVASGARLDVMCSSKHITPFYRAAMDNNVNICILFAAQGADISQRDVHGNSPLDLIESPRLRRQIEEVSRLKAQTRPRIHGQTSEGRATISTGFVVRVEADVHVPAHSTDDDLTPDNIHTRPCLFVNSLDKPTSTAPTSSHQKVIANVSRPRLDDASHQMLHLEEAPVRGSQVIDNLGNLHQPSEAAALNGRMYHGLDQRQPVIQQPNNLSQIAAAQTIPAMQSHGQQHMTSIAHQKDTGRHRQKKPSQSGNSDITRNRENVLGQLPQDQKTQAEAMLNCITSEVAHVTPVMQSHDTNESQQDSNVKGKATYTDELVRLRQENSQLLAQVETLRQEESQWKHQIENFNFKTERKQLYCTIADSRRKRNEAKRNRDEEIAEVDELSDMVKALTVENKQVQEDYQQTMDQKQKEIDGLKQEKSDLQRELGQRQQDLIGLRQENETVCQQLVRQERLTASLQEDKEDLQRRNQHCSRALGQAQRKLECQEICRNISEEELEVTKLRLGGGAYGEVRMGRWQGVDVAVKTFHEHLRSDLDVLVRERMIKIIRREVSICAQVCHPNVVATCGATFTLDFPLRLVMELMEGSLENVIDAANEVKRYLTMREKVDLAAGCVCGLMYLHGMPGTTLHGDIRPSNVLVTLTMEAKIGDLGAPRLATSTSVSVGQLSRPYIAPERMVESGGNPVHNSVQADIYSLGVTLLELFTGLGADPDEREEQLSRLSHPRLLAVTSKLLPHNPQERIKSEVALKMLLSAKEDRSYKASPPKRMVKGIRSGSQKLELVDKPWM